jgi:hypothetical protein
MRAFWLSLVLLALILCLCVGCSNCPVHRALFGSGDKESVPAESQATTPSPAESGA